MSGGLHLGPPGFIFIKFPSTQISADINDATCVSKDGLRVKFGVSFQYQLPMEWVKPVVVKYRNMDKWGGIVYAAGMSAVQHSCSKYDISNFQNKRGIIQSEMESKLRIKLEGPNGDGAGDHARASGAWLTCAQPLKAEGAVQAGVSVDQVAAQHASGATPFRGLAVGGEPPRTAGQCDSGYSEMIRDPRLFEPTSVPSSL